MATTFQRARPDQPRDLVLFEHFFLQQRPGEGVQLLPVRGQDGFGRLVALGQQSSDFFIDDGRRPLADVRAPGQLATEENGLRRIIEGEEAHLLAHPPAHHHVARKFRRRFQVVLRAGRDRSQPQLFSGASFGLMLASKYLPNG